MIYPFRKFRENPLVTVELFCSQTNAAYFRRTRGRMVYVVVQRYGPVKPLPVLDAVSTWSSQSYHGRYSVRSVSALIARLVSSSVRFNADLPLANVFTSAPAHLLLSPRSPASAGDNKVPSLLLYWKRSIDLL